MNKRQRKKLYKKKTGKNPTKEMGLSGENFNKITGLANITRRPYFKPVIIFKPREVWLPKEEYSFTFPTSKELIEGFKQITEELYKKRYEYLLREAKKEIAYTKNTENVVNVTRILTRYRKMRKRKCIYTKSRT